MSDIAVAINDDVLIGFCLATSSPHSHVGPNDDAGGVRLNRSSFHAVSSHLKTGPAGIDDLRDVLRDPVQCLAHGVRTLSL